MAETLTFDEAVPADPTVLATAPRAEQPAAEPEQFTFEEMSHANPPAQPRPTGAGAEIASRMRQIREFGLDKDKTGVDYFRSKLPFFGSAGEARNDLRTIAAANRIAAGTHTGQDLYDVAMHLVKSENEDKKSFGRKVADAIANIPGFALEFAATGGLYSGGRAAAMGGIKKVVGAAAEKGVGRFATAVASRGIGVAAQTAFNPGMVAHSTTQQMMPQLTPQVDENGQVQSVDVKPGRAFLSALPRGAADALIEVGSERAGARLGKLFRGAGSFAARNTLGRLPLADRAAALHAGIMQRWLAMKPGRTAAQFVEAVKKHGGYDGVLGEVLEERAGDVGRLATGVEKPGENVTGQLATGKYKQAVEQLAIEGLSFAVPGLAGGAAVRMAGGKQTAEAARPQASVPPEAEPAPQATAAATEPSPSVPATPEATPAEEPQPQTPTTPGERAPPPSTATVREFVTKNPQAAKAIADKAASGKPITRDDFKKAGLDFVGNQDYRNAFGQMLVDLHKPKSAATPSGDNSSTPAETADFEPGPVSSTGATPTGKWSQTPPATATKPTPAPEQTPTEEPSADTAKPKPVGTVTGFTTAKGSTYTVDGRSTQRTKSEHAGHEKADVGVKQPSAFTLYVSPLEASLIGGHGTMNKEARSHIRIDEHGIHLVSWNQKEDRWGRIGQPITFSHEPAVGLSPVEFWNRNGKQAWHAGNEITSLTHAEPEATAPPKKSPMAGIKRQAESLAKVEATTPDFDKQLPSLKELDKWTEPLQKEIDERIDNHMQVAGKSRPMSLSDAYEQPDVRPLEERRQKLEESYMRSLQQHTLADVSSVVASMPGLNITGRDAKKIDLESVVRVLDGSLLIGKSMYTLASHGDRVYSNKSRVVKEVAARLYNQFATSHGLDAEGMLSSSSGLTDKEKENVKDWYGELAGRIYDAAASNILNGKNPVAAIGQLRKPEAVEKPNDLGQSPKNWLVSLPENHRQAVFAEMRNIDKRAQQAMERSKSLRPPAGTIGVGNADFDPMLQSEALGSYLRGLRNGLAPDQSLEAAKADSRKLIENWNTKGVKSRAGIRSKEEMKLWEGSADHYLESAHRQIVNSLPADAALESQQDQSNGAATETPKPAPRTKAFKAWFAGSKVVDAAGKPQVVYHGTPKGGFTAFDPSRAGARGDLVVGPAIYFTDDASIAGSKYEQVAGVMKVGTPQTYDVYLSVKTPLDLRSTHWDEATVDRVVEGLNKGGLHAYTIQAEPSPTIVIGKDAGTAKIVSTNSTDGTGNTLSVWNQLASLAGGQKKLNEILHSAGFDGIVFSGTHVGGEKFNIWAVFSPNQIKSASGNRGTFDAADPDIMHGAAAGESEHDDDSQEEPPEVSSATATAAPSPSPAPAAPNIAVQPAETSGGQALLAKLQQDAERKGPKKVGLRSIVDWLNREIGVLMLVGKSQTTKKNPAHYRRSVHTVRARNGYSQLNIHEAGHAISNMLDDKLPGWRRGYGDELKALTYLRGSMASAKSIEEGLAEFTRLFVVDQSTLSPRLLNGLLGAMGRVDANIPKLLRDTHRAWQFHRARPIADQMQSLQNDKGRKPPIEQAVSDAMTSFAYYMAGGSAVINRLIRRAHLGIGGDSLATRYFDPAGLIGLGRQVFDGQYREQQKLAREIMSGMEDTPADLETAYQATVAIPREVWRAIGGVKGGREGIRVRSTGEGFQNGPTLIREAFKELGMTLPEHTTHGEWMYLGNDSLAKIKHDVGLDSWQAFVVYGQYKAALARAVEAGHRYPGVIDGLKPAVVQAEIERLEEENPQWIEHFNRVNGLMDQLLLVAHLSGEVSLEDVARIKQAYSSYWPLPRQVEDRNSRAAGGGADPTAGISRAFGSELPFRTLEEAVEVRTKMALEAYYTNRLMMSLKEFSRTLGQDKRLPFDVRKEQMQIMLPLTMDKFKAATVSPAEESQIVADAVNRRTLEDGGYPSQGLSSAQLAKAVEAVVGPEAVADPEDVIVSRPGRALWRLRKPNAIHVISPWENGQRTYYQLTDPLLFDIFTRSRNPGGLLGVVGKVLGGVVQPWKRGLTQNLVFAVANSVSRDPVTAMSMGKHAESLVPFLYTATAMVARLKGGEHDAAAESELLSRALDATSQDAHRSIVGKFFDMLQEGVVVPGWQEMSLSDKLAYLPGQAMSAILKPVDVMNWTTGGRFLSSLGEELTREGAYLREKQRGASDERAQLQYDRITGNFGERPGNAGMAALVRTTGFLNPAIQIGWGQMQRMTHPDPKVRAMHFAAKLPVIAMWGGAAAAINYLMILAAHPDDDDREAILEAMRERQDRDRMSYMAVAGKVRLPFDYGPVGGVFSYGYNSVEGWLLGDPVGAKEKAKGFLGRFADVPGLGDAINPMIKTGMEANINYSFFYDREIVPGFLEEKFPYNTELQSLPDTPQAYEQVAAALAKGGVRVSPVKIQYVVQQSFARQYDELAKAFDRYQQQRPFELADLPLIGRLFLREPRGFTSQSVRTLVDLDGEYKSLMAAIKEGVSQRPDDPELKQMATRAIELAPAHRQMLEIGKLWDDVRQLRSQPGGGGDKVPEFERRMTTDARKFIVEQRAKADEHRAAAVKSIGKDARAKQPVRRMGESLEKYQSRVAAAKSRHAAAGFLLDQADEDGK